MTHLEAAVNYARQGLPVVILQNPLADGGCSCKMGSKCTSIGKHPRTKHGLKDATTDLAQIEEWWDRWPEANIGIPTGKVSGWLVLDIDPDHGGEDSLRKLINTLDDIPLTLMSETGSGGMHIIFEYPKDREIRGKVGILPGLDIRAEGNYVVVPPSRHASGRRYQWL